MKDEIWKENKIDLFMNKDLNQDQKIRLNKILSEEIKFDEKCYQNIEEDKFKIII